MEKFTLLLHPNGKGAPLHNYKLVILRHSLFLYPSGHRTRKARKHVVFLTVTDRLNRKKWSSKIDEKACGNAE